MQGGRFIGIAGCIHAPSPSALARSRARRSSVRIRSWRIRRTPARLRFIPLSARHAKKATHWVAFFACLAERGGV